MTPANDLIAAIASHPAYATALSDDNGQKLSYGELLAATEAVGNDLQSAGVTGLAICGDNSIVQAVLDIACLQAGIWTLQIPPFFTVEQISHALQQTGCCHMTSDTPLDAATGSSAETHTIQVAGRTVYLTRLTYHPLPAQVLEHTAKVTFTSGSTATPKGLCLGVEHLLAPVAAIAEKLSAQGLRRHVSVLPQAVLLETVAGIYTSLYLGACCVIPSLHCTSAATQPGEALYQSLQRYRANTAILVPQLLEQLVNTCEQKGATPQALRFIAVGGSHVSRSLLQRAETIGMPVYEGYGLSEAGSVVSLNLPGANKPGSAGQVLSHQHVTISNNNEIVLGRQGFLGFCGDNTAQRKACPAELATGDCGFIDADGFLHINGRIKDILITSMGRNVSPEWVETVMLDQPAISQILVYGDGQATLSALIVSNETTDCIQQAVTTANLKLPGYARVHDWQQVPPFSRQQGLLTANGKLRRGAILEQWQITGKSVAGSSVNSVNS